MKPITRPQTSESHLAMRAAKPRFPMPLVARVSRAAVLMATVGMLASCGTNRDDMTTGSIGNDYRQRHPITLTEVEHTVEIPIASGDRRLTPGTRDVIAGFAADYRQRASGSVQVLIPQGAYNSGAAASMRKQIRSVLAANGVPMNRIIETSYQASGDGIAPIRLSYVAMSAVTSPCGEWPEDLVSEMSIANKNYHNFGCASQNNLAAQLENPMDLVAPRKSAPVDATQRANVINVYREAASGTTE